MHTLFRTNPDIGAEALSRAARTAITPDNYRDMAILFDRMARFMSNYGINDARFADLRIRLDSCRNSDKSFEIIHDGLVILDELMRTLPSLRAGTAALPLTALPAAMETPAAEELPAVVEASATAHRAAWRDWPLFHGNHRQDGYTDDPGPARGTVAWKFPTGSSWYARPAVSDGRVYAPSPGITSAMFCLDLISGETIWELGHKSGERIISGNYGSPRLNSSVYVCGNYIIARESGSWESGPKSKEGKARRVWILDRETGDIVRVIEACHLDYRIGYAPLAASSEYIACPWGELHSISKSYARPDKITQVPGPLDRLVCFDTNTGRMMADLPVGPFYSEPVIAGEWVYLGDAGGVLHGMDMAKGQERWVLSTGASIHGTVLVAGDVLYIGNEQGEFFKIDRFSGAILWKIRVTEPNPAAFQLFSRATVYGRRLYVGSANHRLHALNTDSGQCEWEFVTDDWVRAQPVVLDGRILLATMQGTVQALMDRGTHAEVSYIMRVSDFPILGDLVPAESTGSVLVSTADLQLVCLEASTGSERWRHHLIKRLCVDGEWIDADNLGGGSDFQSSPVIADGRVFIGCPNRFVYALDRGTGRFLWKFETRGQVSAAPVCTPEGYVCFGQQGGDLTYYCVHAAGGSLAWKKELTWVWHASGYAQGKILVPGCNGTAYALDVHTGKTLWQVETGGGCYPTPTVRGEMAFFSSWDNHYYGIRLTDGQVIWKTNITGTPDSGASCLYRGKLYASALLNRDFYCLDAATGEILWKLREDPGYDCNVTPTVRDHHMVISYFFRYDCCLWRIIPNRTVCIDPETGRTLWEFPAGGGLTSAMISGDRVYFASTNDPFFYCVDLYGRGHGTTTLHWRLRLSGQAEESCPAIAGGKAYIYTDSGYLFAVE